MRFQARFHCDVGLDLFVAMHQAFYRLILCLEKTSQRNGRRDVLKSDCFTIVYATSSSGERERCQSPLITVPWLEKRPLQ